MRIHRSTLQHATALLATLLLFVSVSPAKTHKTTHKTSKTSKTRHVKHSSKHKRTSRVHHKRVRGQRSIDDQRAEQIQAALIREHYLDGTPSGEWDQRSKEAMQRYQAANGWQTKVVPDSRALIKLGLGPSKDNLINPETAAVASAPTSVPVNAPDATANGAASTFRQ